MAALYRTTCRHRVGGVALAARAPVVAVAPLVEQFRNRSGIEWSTDDDRCLDQHLRGLQAAVGPAAFDGQTTSLRRRRRLVGDVLGGAFAQGVEVCRSVGTASSILLTAKNGVASAGPYRRPAALERVALGSIHSPEPRAATGFDWEIEYAHEDDSAS